MDDKDEEIVVTGTRPSPAVFIVSGGSIGDRPFYSVTATYSIENHADYIHEIGTTAQIVGDGAQLLGLTIKAFTDFLGQCCPQAKSDGWMLCRRL